MPDRPDPFRHGSSPGQVLTALSMVSLALKSSAWRDAGPRGLNPTQSQMLVLLLTAPAPLRLREVAEGLAVTTATASEAVSAMVRKGLIIKTVTETDQRARAITLTPEGRTVARMAGRWAEGLLKAVRAVPEERRGPLIAGLLEMILALQRSGQIAPARMCLTCRHFQPRVRAEDQVRPHYCAFFEAAFGDADLRADCREHASLAGKVG